MMTATVRDAERRALTRLAEALNDERVGGGGRVLLFRDNHYPVLPPGEPLPRIERWAVKYSESCEPLNTWLLLTSALESAREHPGSRIYRLAVVEDVTPVPPAPVPSVTVGGRTWTKMPLGHWQGQFTSEDSTSVVYSTRPATSDESAMLDALWAAHRAQGGV
jgi:hypothetical protein